MKNFTKQALAIVVIAAFAVAGCKKGSEGSFDRANGAGGPFNGPDSVLVGNISTSRTLSPGKVYKLNGVVYVTNNAKLTIQPGTVITTGEKVGYKELATSSEVKQIAGVLVITRGAKIDALGTADQPIVFTSPKAVNQRVAGDFGGVVILGKSLTNKPSTTVIEGLPQFDANGVSLNVDVAYGGGDSADDSGTFQYVRIEYAGYKLKEDNEINGLTMGGVGSQTDIDHVQVSFGADDAFEFFGGTVNASYLLALANDDDDFDTDFGYSGHITYAIGLKDPSSTHSVSNNISDSNGIESDNDNIAGNVATPRTKPVYTNITLLGYGSAGSSTLRAGNRWRRNTDLIITKSIIAGFNAGVEFQNDTFTNATAGGFTDNKVHAYTAVFTAGSPSSLTGSTNFTSNTTSSSELLTFIGLSNPFYTTANSSSYKFSNLLSSTDYGAVTNASFDEWNSGWVVFTPQSSVDSGL